MLTELRLWSRDQLLSAGCTDVPDTGYWVLPVGWRARVYREVSPGDLVATVSDTTGQLSLWGLPVYWEPDAVPYLHLDCTRPALEDAARIIATWWRDRIHAGFTVLGEYVDRWEPAPMPEGWT